MATAAVLAVSGPLTLTAQEEQTETVQQLPQAPAPAALQPAGDETPAPLTTLPPPASNRARPVPTPVHIGQVQGQVQTLRAQPVQEAHPVTGDEEMINSIQFPNAKVQDVLDFYEKLTGKKLVYDNTVQGQVNIVVNKPVTKQEALRIIETTLLLNGFTLVPGPGDIVKVLGNTKNPRQFTVPMFSDPSQIPESEQVISFLFKLEYANPVEVAQLLAGYITPPSPYTLFFPLPKSQAIIVTESSSVIRSLVQVIAELDRPPAEVVSVFIPLERADAKDILDKLTAIFEKQPTQGGAPGTPVAPVAVQPPASAEQGEAATAQGSSATLSEDSLIVGKIKLTADIRTNRIHVVTRPINLPFIRKLIAEFDSDIPFGEPTTRPLRFVSAGDVLDVVVKAITEPGTKVEEGGGSSHIPGQATPVNNASSVSGRSSSNPNGGPALGTEELATKDVDTTPEARTVGNTKIIADKRANTIIVLGNREVKEKIFKVLDQIDVRSPQVMLTAVIGELTLNDNEEFGVDYLLHKGKLASSGSNAVTGIVRGLTGATGNIPSSSLDLSSLVTAAGVPSAGGVTALIGATNSLDVIVHALESTGRFHITSRPMVFTSNNKKALISSGQQIAVPANIQSSFTGTADLANTGLVSQSSVEYKDVVLKLEVQPLINSDKEVTLDIVQEVNSVSGSTLISGNSIPTIASRKIKTTVSVANEATIVLGGLVQETKQTNKSGIPVLSRIPVLGSLFGSRTKGVTRTELVVLIRPTVTNTPEGAIKAGERAQEKLNFPPDLEDTLDPVGTRVKGAAQPQATQKFLLPPKAVLRSEK